MPPLSSGLIEWLQQQGMQAGVLAFLGLLWYEVKASEAGQVKRIDQLRADMKEGFAQCRAEQRASEATQREDMADLKIDNRALGEKLDHRLVESLLAAKQRSFKRRILGRASFAPLAAMEDTPACPVKSHPCHRSRVPTA